MFKLREFSLSNPAPSSLVKVCKHLLFWIRSCLPFSRKAFQYSFLPLPWTGLAIAVAEVSPYKLRFYLSWYICQMKMVCQKCLAAIVSHETPLAVRELIHRKSFSIMKPALPLSLLFTRRFQSPFELLLSDVFSNVKTPLLSLRYRFTSQQPYSRQSWKTVELYHYLPRW